jgi:hypothetical protein
MYFIGKSMCTNLSSKNDEASAGIIISCILFSDREFFVTKWLESKGRTVEEHYTKPADHIKQNKLFHKAYYHILGDINSFSHIMDRLVYKFSQIVVDDELAVLFSMWQQFPEFLDGIPRMYRKVESVNEYCELAGNLFSKRPDIIGFWNPNLSAEEDRNFRDLVIHVYDFHFENDDVDIDYSSTVPLPVIDSAPTLENVADTDVMMIDSITNSDVPTDVSPLFKPVSSGSTVLLPVTNPVSTLGNVADTDVMMIDFNPNPAVPTDEPSLLKPVSDVMINASVSNNVMIMDTNMEPILEPNPSLSETNNETTDPVPK